MLRRQATNCPARRRRRKEAVIVRSVSLRQIRNLGTREMFREDELPMPLTSGVCGTGAVSQPSARAALAIS